MHSSGDNDIVELESSTDSKSILNTEKQSEAEDAKDSLNVTNRTSEKEAKESKQETFKGQEMAKNVAERRCATSSKHTEYTGKNQQTQKFQNQKKSHRNLVVKQSTEEKINSDPRALKKSTRSSSLFKLVPEKLKNYVKEQDEEYFSGEEANDGFVSGESSKKYWNRKERQVRPEHRVMEYHYVFFWHCYPFLLLHLHLVSIYTVMILTKSYQQRSIL